MFFFLISCKAQIPYTWLDFNKNYLDTSWKKNQQQLSMISKYQIQGNFIYVSNKQKICAKFHWKQNGDKYHNIIIIHPLGFTLLQIIIKPEYIKYINYQNQYYTNKNLNDILLKFTGIELKINDIQKWMIGIPGTAKKFKINDIGYLDSLEYGNNDKMILIQYTRYHNKLSPKLPANIKIKLKNNNYLKLNIHRWNIS